MVTYYNVKDLVKFGNYLLSDERKALTREGSQGWVNDTDVENWKLSLKKD